MPLLPYEIFKGVQEEREFYLIKRLTVFANLWGTFACSRANHRASMQYNVVRWKCQHFYHRYRQSGNGGRTSLTYADSMLSSNYIISSMNKLYPGIFICSCSIALSRILCAKIKYKSVSDFKLGAIGTKRGQRGNTCI